MQINTTRFGAIDVAPERVIHFPLGLLGFETTQRFVLIDSDEIAPLRWLQAVDDADVAFPVVEPYLFFPDYAFKLTGDDRKLLEIGQDTDYAVVSLVVIPDDPSQMTVNLMGPLVMNPDKRLGKQMVLHDGGFSPRQRLLPDAAQQEEPALV
ncbi:Flagellar assembly factor FliW [compost metagenome]